MNQYTMCYTSCYIKCVAVFVNLFFFKSCGAQEAGRTAIKKIITERWKLNLIKWICTLFGIWTLICSLRRAALKPKTKWQPINNKQVTFFKNCFISLLSRIVLSDPPVYVLHHLEVDCGKCICHCSVGMTCKKTPT